MFKKTKIVCTIGPSSWEAPVLEKMILSGMDLARLNFSHGTHEEKRAQIKLIRTLSEKLKKPVGIIADLQGPKLRLGEIEGKIDLKKGQRVQLSINPIEDEIPVQFDISKHVKKGQRIMLNDGLVELKVTEVVRGVVKVIVINDGWVSSHKGMNLPDTKLTRVALTDKDREDAIVALDEHVDYINLSFVQAASDIDELREMIEKRSSQTKVMVKIEKPRAVDNLEEIIKAVDAVMVARGDLAVETSDSVVPLIQKRIIRLARLSFKPVIVATQMLESMRENPRPTRAEVSDVANAVFDQADAVMLSAESASGKYPVESVAMMTEIINNVESQDEYKNHIGLDFAEIDSSELESRAIASAAVILSEVSGVKLLVAGTRSGRTIQSLSSFRPAVPLIGITHDKQVLNQLSLIWGVRPFLVKALPDPEEFWREVLELVKKEKLAQKKDKVVILSGPKIGVSGQTDTIKIEVV